MNASKTVERAALRERVLVHKLSAMGFARGAAEERRAAELVSRGLVTREVAIYSMRTTLAGEQIVSYRWRYTLTAAGRALIAGMR
jgi:hypothetical protein